MDNFLDTYYKKSIRLTPDGFSLYGLPENGNIKQAYYPSKENALLSNLAPEFFGLEDDSQMPLDIIVSTRMPMLIPDIMYDDAKAKDFLRMQFDISQFGQSFNETLGRYRSLFFLTQNEYSTLHELNCIPTFKSEVSIIYDFLKQQQSTDSVFLSVNESYADFLVIQNGEPLLVNRTKHVENVDILYYTINCMQQTGLSSPTLYIKHFSKSNKKMDDLLSQYLDNIIIL